MSYPIFQYKRSSAHLTPPAPFSFSPSTPYPFLPLPPRMTEFLCDYLVQIQTVCLLHCIVHCTAKILLKCNVHTICITSSYWLLKSLLECSYNKVMFEMKILHDSFNIIVILPWMLLQLIKSIWNFNSRYNDIIECDIIQFGMSLRCNKTVSLFQVSLRAPAVKWYLKWHFSSQYDNLIKFKLTQVWSLYDDVIEQSLFWSLLECSCNEMTFEMTFQKSIP